MPLPQEPQLAEEDLDTNGTILLVETLGTLYVIDVRDPANPKTIGELESPDFTRSRASSTARTPMARTV